MDNQRNKAKIFISWSGENGKHISRILKNVLENDIFSQHLACFVSDTDIASGEDWWNKIKKELKSAKLGIICLTKESTDSPWIHYEAGALVGNNVRTTPLLFNCDINALKSTPLNSRQSVKFHDKSKFFQMIRDINKEFKIVNIGETQFDLLIDSAYGKMKEELIDVEDKLKREGFFNVKYVYPPNIRTINRQTVFVSAPMSTLKPEKYVQQRKGLLEVIDALKRIGFSSIICPAALIEDKEHFEGREKALHDNFINLKQAEAFVMVYESSRPSSSLIELGYAIALCKKTVVFYKKHIPYLLQKAGENIPHVRTVQFKNYNNIIQEIDKNRMALFGEDDNE